MNDFSISEQLDGDLLAQASGMDPQEMIRDGRTLQRIGGKYSTAITVQQPRNLQMKAKQLMAEAKLAGEAFYYGWGSGKDRVIGPSIGLAMSAARVWGNCAIEPQPVQETDTSWIFDCHFIDLETGFTLGRQFRQSKEWTVHGRFDAERKEDIRFQIGQSKCARNVMCNALPKWLIDAAVREAQEGVRQKIEKFVKEKGLAAAVDLVVMGLGKEGVKEEVVLEKCEVADRKGLTIDHVVMLRGDLYALQEGQDRAENLYPSISKDSSHEPTTSSVDSVLSGDVAPRDVAPEAEKASKAKEKPKAKTAAKKPVDAPTQEYQGLPDADGDAPEGTTAPGRDALGQSLASDETIGTRVGDSEPIESLETEAASSTGAGHDAGYVPAEAESVGTTADPGEIIEMPRDFVDMLSSAAAPKQIAEVREYWTKKSGEHSLDVWTAMQAALDSKLGEIRQAARGR